MEDKAVREEEGQEGLTRLAWLGRPGRGVALALRMGLGTQGRAAGPAWGEGLPAGLAAQVPRGAGDPLVGHSPESLSCVSGGPVCPASRVGVPAQGWGLPGATPRA